MLLSTISPFLRKPSYRLSIFSVFMVNLSISYSVMAQDSSSAIIEEVLVTAQKKVESIQDVPIAVSAFSNENLQNAGINDAMGLQFSVPNLVLSRANFTRPNISLRAIGNLAVGVSSDNGTGIHVNGVYLNMPRILETEFYDVDRVEVLRGPQGTLYGRNTTAGVINTITAKPEQEFGGYLRATVGNYDSLKLSGALNIPLTDSLAQRFSLFSVKRDGYTDNVYSGEDIDGRDMYAIRSSTLWDITDSTSANLVISYFEEDSNRARYNKQLCRKDPDGVLGCLPSGLDTDTVHSGATTPGGMTAFLGGLGTFPTDSFANSVNPSDLRKVNMDFDPVYTADETFVSLEIIHHMETLTLTSLTGYQDTAYTAFMDFDGNVASEPFPVSLPVDLGSQGVVVADRYFSVDESGNDASQWSQELRVDSQFEGSFNFIAGLYYLTFDNEDRYKVRDNVLQEVGSEVFGKPVNESLIFSDNKVYELETWALFGEAYFDLSDLSRLTLGLRYTDESKEVSSRLITPLVTPDYLGNKESWQEVTGKLGIDHQLETDFTDQSLLFATLSRGYKGGGFNPSSGSDAPQPFDPEYINALELGSKNQLLDNRLQANFTLFYYDIDGLQVAKLAEFSSFNENVDGTVKGLETEFVWLPTAASRIDLNIAWLDSELGTSSSVDPADPAQTGSGENVISTLSGNQVMVNGEATKGIPVSLRGNELPNAPPLSVKLGAEHSFYLDSGWELVPRIDYYWQDEFYARIYNTANDSIDAWSVFDVSVRTMSPDEVWQLTAFVKNVRDENYITGQHLGSDTAGLPTSVFLLEPRTYGVTLDYRF